MSKARFAVITLIAGGLLAAGGATAASAGVTPTPVPVPSHHRVVAVPWQFDLEQSNLGGIAVNDVESDSPGGILMHRWTDTQNTPNIDTFSDTTGDSITLWHNSISLADVEVNLRVCSVALDQTGRFRIINGTGTGAGIRSLGGQFTLRGLFSFDLVRQHRYGHDRAVICPLAFLSPHQVVRDIVRGSGLPVPTLNAVDVQGRADLVRVHPVHIFAPTASPAVTAAA